MEGKIGKCLRGELLIDLVATFKLKIILSRAECFTEVLNYSVDRGFYCLHPHQFSAKKTRNRLGGPEEALFERSPGDW